ncbi:ShlB/FhaC/HecB family hemolysin secretion/activation protein [Lysobacter soli]|uniref:ShlB/FhaC/HecB family hemolysin secretion/activation protein n=1 Tax=Lysobacter soli TaxID=453783 RepID=UPI0012EE92B9|nr:ShlB/FhaC/HecB family hemolysin secretion/activation protein [Lysobacter soli]QGW65148.1 ShlB/FhaC/HecB family hemolysin secretion/activation protein [Lysobacter soli]
MRLRPLAAWLVLGGFLAPVCPAWGQVLDSVAQELLRQQERERALREQQETRPDVRMQEAEPAPLDRLPADESPCFAIREIRLTGEEAGRFQWALRAADPDGDPATGRCLGTQGVNVVMKRVQNAIVAHGFVTTRVLAAPQDLNGGVLTLTLVPGRIRAVRFADGDARVAAWNAVPARRHDLLNLRDIEQALENFKRVPTVEADIQIAPAEGADAQPGDSDLVIAWKQRAPFRIGVTLDDSGSEGTGKLQAGATLSLDNALRWNDLFYVNVGHDAFNGAGKGTSSWTAHYDVPFGYWLAGATASSYDYHQNVAGAFETYTYSGTSENAELRVSRLLFRNATMKAGAYARGWWRQSRNYVDDTEVEVQRRRMAGWELGFTHRQFMGQVTLDASVAYRRGTGAFDALPAPEEAFGEGTSRSKVITADAQLAVPFQLGEQRLRYTGSWRAQWDRTPLVPQDRFSIGGRYTVRGFDGELSLAGERGWTVRNDLGLTLGGGQEVYVGADYGHVGGPSAQYLLGQELAGAVIGLRGGVSRWYWDVFVGAAIERPDGFQTDYTTTGFNLGWSY